MTDRYLYCPKYQSWHVVCQDLGTTEHRLLYQEDKLRIFNVEPGNDSCGSLFVELFERPDGTLYKVAENGEVVEWQLLDELPED